MGGIGDVWKWIAVTAVGCIGILLAALATSYSADAEEAVKRVGAECKLDVERCKADSFPLLRGAVLEVRFENIDKKLDRIIHTLETEKAKKDSK